jgi:hypothetical protein
MRAVWLAEDTATPTDAPRVAGLPNVTWAEVAGEKEAAPAIRALEGDLAYILLTPGLRPASPRA